MSDNLVELSNDRYKVIYDMMKTAVDKSETTHNTIQQMDIIVEKNLAFLNDRVTQLINKIEKDTINLKKDILDQKNVLDKLDSRITAVQTELSQMSINMVGDKILP